MVACYDTSDGGTLCFVEETEYGCRVQYKVNEESLSREAFIESAESEFGIPFDIVDTVDSGADANIVLQAYFTDDMIGSRPRNIRHLNVQFMGAVVDRVGKAFVWPNGSVTRAGIRRLNGKFTGNQEVVESLRMTPADIVATDTLNYTVSYLGTTLTVADGSISDGILLDWYQ